MRVIIGTYMRLRYLVLPRCSPCNRSSNNINASRGTGGAVKILAVICCGCQLGEGKHEALLSCFALILQPATATRHFCLSHQSLFLDCLHWMAEG